MFSLDECLSYRPKSRKSFLLDNGIASQEYGTEKQMSEIFNKIR